MSVSVFCPLVLQQDEEMSHNSWQIIPLSSYKIRQIKQARILFRVSWIYHEYYPHYNFLVGDVARDAFAVRLFMKNGHEIALTQSYAKNMGLYGKNFNII
jgi:Aspartate/tyrosine/aromatic aminotransferase